MITKYNLFDIGGTITKDDSTCRIYENIDIEKFLVKRIILYREKFYRPPLLKSDNAYFVVDGKGIIETKDSVVHIKSNDLLFLPKNMFHKVINDGDVNLMFLTIEERK